MSLATDTRYRNVRVSFLNNDQDGSELVQLLAKPSGGTWSAQRMFPVSIAGDQEVQWESALPLTLYDIALRYMIGSVAATGYESSDPDAWTASTAAGSKGTVTTSCAVVTGLAGSGFVSAATPISLTWACANQAVPFLVEKNLGAGWVTVVAGLVATSYQYTIPAAELNTTVEFRVTPKRGSVAGSTASPISVVMQIVVGATTWISGVWDDDAGLIALAWNAVSGATAYLLETTQNGGASWSTVGTINGTSYSYLIYGSGAVNITWGFRLTGQNGAVSGSVSGTQNVATPWVPVAPTVVSVVPWIGGGTWITVTLTGGSGPATVTAEVVTAYTDPSGSGIWGYTNVWPMITTTTISFFPGAPSGTTIYVGVYLTGVYGTVYSARTSYVVP